MTCLVNLTYTLIFSITVDGSRKEDNQEDMDTHFLKYSRLKHLMHCLALFSLIFLMEYTAFEKHQKNLQSGQAIDSWIEYGIVVTLFCYSLKMLVLLALPQSILNFLGLVCYNAFPGKSFCFKKLNLLINNNLQAK